MKVPDGLRYHIIDIWIDELDKADDESEMADDLEVLIGPLKQTESKGMHKTIRTRARVALEDERLKDWRSRNDESSNEGGTAKSPIHHEGVSGVGDDDNDEWGGIED